MAGGRRSAYYAGFLDLVRRQLRRDYEAEDLEQKGLRVFTSLDPAIQSIAEIGLIEELERLQPGRPELEGALIVTNPHNGEVRALVGGRRTGFDGFNRALDAKRQIGSLIKPAVYLAAIESGAHTLADLIDDAPIDIELDNGRVWSPGNFNDETHGTVTAVRALSESFNMATVRLGTEVGADRVAELLARLGLDAPPAAYPSLLLGAIELSPLEVTRIYNTIANGGFRSPLHAVRVVVDRDGQEVQRYRLEIEQTVESGPVYTLNQALVQVMERGTGRGIRRALPASLTSAGKTGTSDGLRDSWFAGFTNEHLVVTWVGNDANESIGLTGSTGAGRLWARVVANLDASSFVPPQPAGLQAAWIDYYTGLETDAGCATAVPLAMPYRDLPPIAAACGSSRQKRGTRIRRWLRSARQ
jgi:penicillin-binding protein 1B